MLMMVIWMRMGCESERREKEVAPHCWLLSNQVDENEIWNRGRESVRMQQVVQIALTVLLAVVSS